MEIKRDRAYHDLYCLLGTEQVRAMLAIEEYAEIKEDYKRVSEANSGRDYFEPTSLSFASRDAIFPSTDLWRPDRTGLPRPMQCAVLW